MKGYQGSEFCAGLLFGMHGSNLLLNIARLITTQADAHIARLKDGIVQN